MTLHEAMLAVKSGVRVTHAALDEGDYWWDDGGILSDSAGDPVDLAWALCSAELLECWAEHKTQPTYTAIELLSSLSETTCARRDDGALLGVDSSGVLWYEGFDAPRTKLFDVRGRSWRLAKSNSHDSTRKDDTA